MVSSPLPFPAGGEGNVTCKAKKTQQLFYFIFSPQIWFFWV
jgi:hypothetical protein